MADTATATTDKQEVVGPDGKKYKFSKNISPQRIDKYFTKQGWVKDKSGKWLTASGESAKKEVPSETPSLKAKFSTGLTVGGGTKVSMGLGDPKENVSATKDYIGTSLPSIGGAAGGIVGGSPGAALGGAIGQVIKDITVRPSFLEAPQGARKIVSDIVIETAKQGALQKVGDIGGELFFKALSKIPHAVIKNGIKLLPSETGAGGKITRYVEDLLGNLFPSAGTMEAFKAGQSGEIVNKIESFAQGMSKFDGTPEEMGKLVKTAMESGENSGQKAVDAARTAYIKKGYSAKQAEQYLAKTNLYKNFVKEYKNQLAQSIIKTNKPEAIAGMLTSSSFAHEDVRTFVSTLEEMHPDTLGKAQNRIMRDMLSQTLTKFKDPVAKGAPGMARKFGGDHWVDTLNKVGEERLKAIYGETGYKNIEEFTKIVGLVGRNAQGSSIGKFMNLMLFLSPIRSGLSPKTLTHTGLLSYALNRTAKVITSTEGIKLTNNYLRATISNSPRLINLAREELNKFNERSDLEYQKEELEGEQEYMAEHNKNKEKK
jgi:hypothetical protein